MSDHSALDRFLRTDPRDVGCEQALAVLHIYVDLVLDDAVRQRGRLALPGRRRAPAGLRAVCGRLARPTDRGRHGGAGRERLPADDRPGQPHRTGPPPHPRACWPARSCWTPPHAIYVWEWPNYPQYYIPIADVRADLLVDEQHDQKLSRGTARQHGLRVGDVTRPEGAAGLRR